MLAIAAETESSVPEFHAEPQRPAWFALHVKSRREKLVAAALRGKGYQEFVPMYRSRRQWSDRVADVETPLFPGYVFCRLDLNERLPVLTTPGVVAIVGFGKRPHPIADQEVEAIRTIVRSGLPAQPWPFLEVGQPVRIERGPLADLAGILLEIKKSQRLVVSVSLLRRSVAVEIEPDWARPVASSLAACR